jgi:hypothetical protein
MAPPLGPLILMLNANSIGIYSPSTLCGSSLL